MSDQDPFIYPGDTELENGNSIGEGVERPGPKEVLELWPDDPTQIMSKKPAKFKKSDHNLRTRKLFEDAGWFIFRVDQTRMSAAGSIYTVDFLGLFDWLACKPGRQLVGVQICAKSSLGSHITKMTSSEQTSFNKARKIDNLERWMKCGFRVVLIGWEKVGARWQHTERELDQAEVEKALARKRRTA